MIHYITGDATAPCKMPALIVHVCNDVGKWGAGFTGALSKRWPEVERHYRRTIKANKSAGIRSLGEWWFHQLNDDPIVVANLVAQRGVMGDGSPTPNIRYAVLETCLEEITKEARLQMPDHTLHMPRIGCGLAGGDWAIVEAIIQRTCGDLDVYVYDLPKGTP